MALVARRRLVSAGQWKRRILVVESGRLPHRSAMANRAIVREQFARVIGIAGSVEICTVAREAIRRRAIDRPVMALAATYRKVRSRQHERRGGMVEGGRLPRRGRMAVGAGSIKLSLQMVGVDRPFVGIPMTAITRGRCSRKVAVGVTSEALQVCVRARQRKSRVRMREIAVPPAVGVMALAAIVGKTLRHVIRIGGSFEIRLMAGIAICRSPRKLPVDVALRAVYRRVPPGQRER